MVGKFGCLVYLTALLASFLGGSVMKIDLYGAMKKKRVTSVFGLQVMLRGSVFVSGPCPLKLSCVTISNPA